MCHGDFFPFFFSGVQFLKDVFLWGDDTICEFVFHMFFLVQPFF